MLAYVKKLYYLCTGFENEATITINPKPTYYEIKNVHIHVSSAGNAPAFVYGEACVYCTAPFSLSFRALRHLCQNAQLKKTPQGRFFLAYMRFFLYLCSQIDETMILYPNCKINLGLRVIRKREDGYHDLETIFVPIYALHDELEVNIAPTDLTDLTDISFELEGITVDCSPEDNLIVKCYRLMAAKYPQIGPVSIRFKKNIPFGAGLGGGSSDAAHMALALNELFQLGLTKEQLAAEVASLGADCAFFIYNVPCFAEGIGDILTPIDLHLSGVRIVLIKPEEGVSTKEAYSGITITGEGLGNLGNLGSLDKLTNDFEATVFPKHPIIATIKKHLLDAGAFYASMSGSGSTVFGLFQNDAEGRTDAQLRALKQQFASMVLLDDTFGEWKA